jgi:thiamine monophosphate synthase
VSERAAQVLQVSHAGVAGVACVSERAAQVLQVSHAGVAGVACVREFAEERASPPVERDTQSEWAF